MKSRETIQKDEMTGYERLFIEVQTNPEFREFCLQGYFDKDIDEALIRFKDSRAWLRAEQIMNLSGNELVLDFGAGRGIASLAIAARGSTTVMSDMNLSKICGLKALKKHIGMKTNPFIIASDAEKMPFADDTFDIVYCNHVLHHAASLDEMTMEAVRVLKPKGLFIAQSEVMRSPFLSDKKWKEQFLPAKLGAHEQTFTTHEYLYAMKKAGISTPKVESLIRPEDFTHATWKGRMAKRFLSKGIGWKTFRAFTTYFGFPGTPILLHGIKG